MKSFKKLLITLSIWRRTQVKLKRQAEHLDNHSKMLTVRWQFFKINQFPCALFLELVLTCPMVKQPLLHQLHLLRYYLFCSKPQSQPKCPKTLRYSFGPSDLRILYSIEVPVWISKLIELTNPIHLHTKGVPIV